MIRSNALIVALKGLTFIPIAAVVYFSDYSKWISYVSSAELGVSGFLIAGLALFGFGVWLKREMIETYLQTSNCNTLFGCVALASSIALYLFGSFYYFENVFHFESLILLAVSYILFRSDARLVRLLAPLFVIVGVSFSSALIIQGLSFVLGAFNHLMFLETILPPFIVSAILLGFFFSYTNPWYAAGDMKTLLSNTISGTWVLPILFVIASLAFWFFPLWPVLVLIPLPLLLLIPGNLRSRLEFPEAGVIFRCARHTASEDGDGYCIICGTKFAEFKRLPKEGFLGLAIVILIVIGLLISQVPLLYIGAGSIPYSGTYSFTGVKSVQIPGSTSSWLLNSSTPISNSLDSYAVKQVYVPSYHPETKNYTVYYELSSSHPYLVTYSWGSLPGWNRSSVPFSIEGFSGSLLTFTSNSSVMMVFAGSNELTFYSGGSFQRLYAGVSMVGNFSSTSANSSSIFISDVDSMLGAVLSAQGFSSGWTDFVQKVSDTFFQLESLLLIGISTVGIGLGTYLVQNYDYRVDSLLGRSSELDDSDWSLFSSILSQRGSEGTTSEIASLAPLNVRDLSGLLMLSGMLSELEKRHLIKKSYSERMGQLFLTWKGVI